MSKGIIDENYLTNIANAIRYKSGTSNNYTPAQMAPAINNIPTSGGGTNTQDATLTSGEQLLSSITAYSQGNKYTGTMNNWGDVSVTPTTSSQSKYKGFYNSLTINAVNSSIDSNISAENIKQGVNILGTVGTYGGGGITEIDVNTISGLHVGHSSWTSVPSIFNFSNVTNFSYMFANSTQLNNLSNVNLANGQDFSYAFLGCNSLNNTGLSSRDFSNATNLDHAFYYCYNMKSTNGLSFPKAIYLNDAFRMCSNLNVENFTIPSTATDVTGMFQGTGGQKGSIVKSTFNVIYPTDFSSMFESANYKTIESLDTANAINMSNMFYKTALMTTLGTLVCDKVTNITNMFYRCNNLTSAYGLINLGCAYSTSASASKTGYGLNLINSNKLTHDSIVNIFSNLYNIAAKGCKTQTIKLNSTALARVSSTEIAVATGKGWTVS